MSILAPRAANRGPDKDLIAQTARLAFEIEAAERREHAAKRQHLRALLDYHHAMTDLLARTESWCPKGQAKVNASRADHVDKAKVAREELEQLEGESDV